MIQKRKYLLGLALLALTGLMPALAAPSTTYWSCNWKGRMSGRNLAKTKPISFTSFQYELSDEYGIEWPFRANSKDTGGQARLQGSCGDADNCWMEQKYISGESTGKSLHFWFELLETSTQGQIKTSKYKGTWGLDPEPHSGEINLESSCKPLKAGSLAGLKTMIDKTLGWTSESF